MSTPEFKCDDNELKTDCFIRVKNLCEQNKSVIYKDNKDNVYTNACQVKEELENTYNLDNNFNIINEYTNEKLELCNSIVNEDIYFLNRKNNKSDWYDELDVVSNLSLEDQEKLKEYYNIVKKHYQKQKKIEDEEAVGEVAVGEEYKNLDEKNVPTHIRKKTWAYIILGICFILFWVNIGLIVSRNFQCAKVKIRDDPYYVAEDKKNSDAANLESFSRLQTQKSKISQAKTDDQTFNTINDKYQNVSSAYDNKLAEKQGAESLIVTDRKIESDKKAILEKLITDASKGKKASDLAIEYKKKYDDLVIQYNNMQVKINQAMLDLAAKKKLVDLTKCILAN